MLQQVNEWLQWVTTGYSRLRSGYIGLQQVTAGYGVDTMSYSRLQQDTEWLQWVTAGCRVVTVIYSMVTAGYRVVTVVYSRLQQVTEWLQWVTEGYSRLPSGYSGLQ